MRDLSLHLLDLAQNSITAGASLVTIRLVLEENGMLTMELADNGKGMSPELLALLRERGLSERHARALLRLETEEQRLEVLSHVLDHDLNVAKTEKPVMVTVYQSTIVVQMLQAVHYSMVTSPVFSQAH